MATIVNFQTDLLRTFVSIIDLGGYTKAGDALGRTQPAISLQMRRLEEIVGAPVMVQKGRSPKLTGEGETLLSYAREILRLNDEAASFFRRGPASGVLRVGLPTDYAVAFLQGVLTEFASAHPDVALEIHCDWSSAIIDKLHADELDIAIAMMTSGGAPYLSRTWVERPIWAAEAGYCADRLQPVPLAAHPEGCAYRHRMIQALDAAGVRWRISYSGPGISGLQNAVVNGLGVSALTRRTLVKGLRVLDESDGFPPLEEIRVGLFYKHPRLSDAGLRLMNQLVARLDDAGVSGDPGFPRASLTDGLEIQIKTSER
jgi:DNA-binding transcriptional LysR family regulator